MLYELWVVKVHRGTGVGTAALDHAVRIASETGHTRLLVKPAPIDDDTTEAELLRWYGHRGFTPWPEQDGVLQLEG